MERLRVFESVLDTLKKERLNFAELNIYNYFRDYEEFNGLMNNDKLELIEWVEYIWLKSEDLDIYKITDTCIKCLHQENYNGDFIEDLRNNNISKWDFMELCCY